MRTPEPRPRTWGFTLLEVLVAVAVLGLLYTVLAGVAIQGLRAEGESVRRLEASLLADRLLAEREVELQEGASPALGRDEQEIDGFTVVTEVSAFELPIALEAPEGLERAASLLGGRGRETLLRRVDVRVRWVEGGDELTVQRTTFGLDLEEAAPLLEGLEATDDAGGDGA